MLREILVFDRYKEFCLPLSSFNGCFQAFTDNVGHISLNSYSFLNSKKFEIERWPVYHNCLIKTNLFMIIVTVTLKIHNRSKYSQNTWYTVISYSTASPQKSCPDKHSFTKALTSVIDDTLRIDVHICYM